MASRVVGRQQRAYALCVGESAGDRGSVRPPGRARRVAAQRGVAVRVPRRVRAAVGGAVRGPAWPRRAADLEASGHLAQLTV